MSMFKLTKDRKGQFRFNIVARTGEIIATSELYPAKAKAMKVIESIRSKAAGFKLVDLTADVAPKAKGAAPTKKPAPKKASKPQAEGKAGGSTAPTAPPAADELDASS